MAVKSRHLAMDIRQRFGHKYVDAAQQMRLGNALIEIEGVEELSLISSLTSHHRRNLLANREETESHRFHRHNRVFQQHPPDPDVRQRRREWQLWVLVV
jgi:hypothetical protein